MKANRDQPEPHDGNLPPPPPSLHLRPSHTRATALCVPPPCTAVPPRLCPRPPAPRPGRSPMPHRPLRTTAFQAPPHNENIWRRAVPTPIAWIPATQNYFLRLRPLHCHGAIHGNPGPSPPGGITFPLDNSDDAPLRDTDPPHPHTATAPPRPCATPMLLHPHTATTPPRPYATPMLSHHRPRATAHIRPRGTSTGGGPEGTECETRRCRMRWGSVRRGGVGEGDGGVWDEGVSEEAMGEYGRCREAGAVCRQADTAVYISRGGAPRR